MKLQFVLFLTGLVLISGCININAGKNIINPGLRILNETICKNLNTTDYDDCLYNNIPKYPRTEICLNISSNATREKCFDLLAHLTGNHTLCEYADKRFCYYSLAQSLKDPELCDKISYEETGLKDSCYILLSKSVGDRNLCNKISNENRLMKEYCLDYFR